jgi:hypothetical protein
MYFDNCLICKAWCVDLFYILWLYLSNLVKILWNVNKWMNEWMNETFSSFPIEISYEMKTQLLTHWILLQLVTFSSYLNNKLAPHKPYKHKLTKITHHLKCQVVSNSSTFKSLTDHTLVLKLYLKMAWQTNSWFPWYYSRVPCRKHAK